ncbi:MAG: glycosyltransferase family 2 protein [Litorilinea sp.]
MSEEEKGAGETSPAQDANGANPKRSTNKRATPENGDGHTPDGAGDAKIPARRPHPRRTPKSAATDSAGSGESEKRESSPIMADPTYSELQSDNRVVMRHQIALNLETFRASNAEFEPRPTREYAALQPVAPPFFTVIIPNFNGMDHLPTVMAALAGQTFQDFEQIVVDDASVDQSLAWLEEHYPTARLIVNRQNVGFAVACNLGAAAARGRFVVLLNSDTEPEPTWLAELAQAICRHPEAALFASKLLLFDRRDTIHAAGDALGRDGIPRNRGVWEQDGPRFEQELEVFGACGGAAAIRRDVWNLLGGFDEAMWMYMEDVDLAFRSRLLGLRTVFVPTARVYHRLSATGGGSMASYYVGRNTLWTLAKNMPTGLLLRNAGAILGAQLGRATAALKAVEGKEAQATLRGMFDGLAGLAPVLAKRRAVQAKRVVSDEELAQLLEA